MLHTKSLIRRLAYVPWMLAVGLVLGWAGEAQAQHIKLTVDKSSVREDAGKTAIKVTATNYTVDTYTGDAKNVGADTYVILGIHDPTGDNEADAFHALDKRYNIELSTIMIPKGKNTADATIQLTPIDYKVKVDAQNQVTTDGTGTEISAIGNNGVDDKDLTDGDADNLIINLNGVSGSDYAVAASAAGRAKITLVDKDQASQRITLSFSPAEISQEAGETEVTVTATLSGELVKAKKLSFPLVVVGTSAWTAELGDPGIAAPTTTEAIRDTDYNIASLPTITIPKNRLSGTAKFKIDPKTGPRWVGIGTTVANDLRYDDVATPDDTNTAAVDESLDGTTDGGTSADTADELQVEIIPNHLTISQKKISELKGGEGKTDGISASPASIREEVGETEITLKITLSQAVTDDEVVKFSIPASDGGTRDVNYTASFTDLTIPAGDTEGTATLTLTPFDNTGTIVISVKAEVGKSEQTVPVTIVDTDASSTEITLSADPGSVKEDAGETDVTITATINGAVLEDDAKLTLVLGNNIGTADKGDGATATRDVDYTAIIRSVTIPAGEVSGSTTVSITPVDDGMEDKDETIKIKSTNKPKNDLGDDITVKMATITLKDTGKREDPGAPVDMTPAFTADDIAASDTVIEGVAGTALEQVLPEATGDGTLTYSVSSGLPAGLSFDSATRTISGTPAAAGKAEIVYTVIDGDTGDMLPAESAALTYNFEIAEKPAPTVEIESVSVTTSSVRENGDATAISVKASLAAAAPVSETIRFTIGAPSGGTAAVRDVDYTASIAEGRFTIDEGATSASTTLTLTPIDNSDEDGDRSIGVYATASGGSASTDVTIADDETASTSISLSASPHTVGEDAGVTNVTITATLNGKVLDADATVTLSVDGASEATRDVDYSALFNPLLTIPARQVSGSIVMLIDPTADAVDEGNETITLNGAIEGLLDGSGLLTISDVAMDETMDPLAFAEGAMIADIGATSGTALTAVELPAASGGSGDIAYTTSELPAGLSFDPATRMLSGTPEAEGSTEVSYMATDAAGGSAMLTFTITVNPMLDFGDLGALFGAFNGGAGKANPASGHGDADITFIVGEAVNLTLPEIPGGTAPKMYSMSGLPASLSFDGATRTISGTPTDVGMVDVTLTVVDAAGASGSLPITVAFIHPPLDAPDALVAEDYKGADGAGDQGGFVLLTWDLSEHHDGIDGYRIFRALPVLNDEMVPWAYVDAVPGVIIGRAIVATLDNVATDWGIAAERDGQTTHGAAKAVFVSAEGMSQSYGMMAETLQASREAVQAGDAPVFAALLPEALAYAQGMAPKLNLVSGVLTSAMTVTEEPVRAIDDIAPLAVPSLSVLDAPNDEGSRIVLTWTLSPSDQLLQDVVALAIGPAAVESVSGVHGYGVYRRAVGEDEFVRVGQVAAGVTSFVDETALNGVRYTYQVRPFDLDNEPVSDIEQTAMAVRNSVLDSEGRALYGLFGADNRIGFDDFFIFADNFGLTAEDAGFDPAFDLSPSAAIDFDDFFVFADNFGRSTAAAGKRVPMFAGLNADARLYLDARTALPSVGEDFVLDVSLADFVAVKGYGLQVQYEASKLEFVEARTDQPLSGSELATPQVLADEAGVLTVAAYGDVVSDGEVALSLVFRPTTEIENTVIEITDSETYDSAFGFNRLVLPAPVQVQTRPEVFALANNYPNPFNPATTIKYALPQAADVALTVYNVLGQPVRTLVAEHQSAGRYVVEWDATNNSGHSLSSGMYFYRLEAGGEFREVKKMLLLK